MLKKKKKGRGWWDKKWGEMMTQNLGLQGKLHMEDWGLCAPSSTPSLWGRAPIILCSPTRLKLSKTNPLRKSCHRAMFLFWVLSFPFFSFKLNMKRVIHHNLSESDACAAGAHRVYWNSFEKGSM